MVQGLTTTVPQISMSPHISRIVVLEADVDQEEYMVHWANGDTIAGGSGRHGTQGGTNEEGSSGEEEPLGEDLGEEGDLNCDGSESEPESGNNSSNASHTSSEVSHTSNNTSSEAATSLEGTSLEGNAGGLPM